MFSWLWFIGAFITGFFACLFLVRRYNLYAGNRIRELGKIILAYQKLEKRLMSALRYSGAHIAFYKRINKENITYLTAYKKREDAMRDMLRQPLKDKTNA